LKILSQEELILSMAAMIMGKGEDSLFGALDADGSMFVKGGAQRRKAQYVRTNWCLPHSVLSKELKDNVKIITRSFIGPIAGVKEEFLSDYGKDLKRQADSSFTRRLENAPRLKAAIKELKEAILEEALTFAGTIASNEAEVTKYLPITCKCGVTYWYGDGYSLKPKDCDMDQDHLDNEDYVMTLVGLTPLCPVCDKGVCPDCAKEASKEALT
jgi:hypothetical protein